MRRRQNHKLRQNNLLTQIKKSTSYLQAIQTQLALSVRIHAKDPSLSYQPQPQIKTQKALKHLESIALALAKNKTALRSKSHYHYLIRTQIVQSLSFQYLICFRLLINQRKNRPFFKDLNWWGSTHNKSSSHLRVKIITPYH